MNKEQIAFVVVVVLLGLLSFTGGSTPAARRSGFRGAARDVERQEASLAAGHFLEDPETVWDRSAANVFLAPRETKDLPPLDLIPPPPPRLVDPGMPLPVEVGGDARRRLRRAVIVDPNLDLAGKPQSSYQGEGDGGTDDAPPDDLDVVTFTPGGLTALERISLSVAELEARRLEQAAASQALEEYRETLDRVYWPTGDFMYGVVEAQGKDESRYGIKLAIDGIRADRSLTADAKKKALDRIRFVFHEDRGRGKPRSRTVYTGSVIERIEFSRRDPLVRYHIGVLTQPKDDATAQLALARIAYEAPAFDLCAQHLEEMLERGQHGVEAFALLSDTYRQLHDYERELRTLQNALAMDAYKDAAELQSRLGQALLALGLPDRADRAFESVLARAPGDAIAHLGAGRIALDRRRGDDAVRHLRQAVTGVGLDRRQRDFARVLLGEAWLLKGDLEAARRSFKSVLDTGIGKPDARALVGMVVVALVESGPAAALTDVVAAREHHPLDGRLTYLEGVLRLQSGAIGPGRESLGLSMELDPFLTPHVRIATSWLYERAGRDEAALAEAGLALEADPSSEFARMRRARCLLNVGDYTGARAEFLRCLAAEPDRVDILVGLGDAAFLGGDAEDGARYYERAARLEPEFPDLLARRLVCHVKRRARAEADAIMKGMDVVQARDAFVQVAMAFYQYYRGKPEETVQNLRRVADNANASFELREYATAVTDAVRANLNKEEWRDDFNRTGTDILKGWKREVGAGINVVLSGDMIRFKGTQRQMSGAPTVFYQERPNRLFESFSLEMDLTPRVGVHAGIGIVAFNRMPRPPEPYDGLQKRDGGTYAYHGGQVALSPAGKLQYRVLDQGNASDWVDVGGVLYEGGSVRLGIEVADGPKNLYRLVVNGSPAAELLTFPGLGRFPRDIELQVFCQATIDRDVEFTVDNVSIITKKKP